VVSGGGNVEGGRNERIKSERGNHRS